jgi:hypothetical protein
MGVLVKAKRTVAAGPLPPASAEVDGVEVTQTIQNLSHQVVLIRGKATVVRIYLQPPTGSKEKLQGEIAVSTAPGAPALYVASLNIVDADLIAKMSLEARRGDLRASLNFVLPEKTRDWPSLAIAVKRIYSSKTDATPALSPTVNLPLTEAPPLRIRAIGLRYARTLPDGTVGTVSPEAIHFDYLRSFLARAYPVAAVDWSQFVVDAPPLFAPPFSGPTTPQGDDPLWRSKLAIAHNQLSAIRAKDVSTGTDPRTHYYGLVSDASAGLFFRGAAKEVPTSPDPSVVAVGPVGDPAQYSSLKWDRDRSYGDWYGAHELAHTFGRFHPGFCGQDASDTAFPYPDGRIGDASRGAMIGLDVGDPALNLPMRVWANETSHDIMTYCDDQWISSYSYQAILDRLRLEDTQFAPLSSAPGAT